MCVCVRPFLVFVSPLLFHFVVFLSLRFRAYLCPTFLFCMSVSHTLTHSLTRSLAHPPTHSLVRPCVRASHPPSRPAGLRACPALPCPACLSARMLACLLRTNHGNLRIFAMYSNIQIHVGTSVRCVHTLSSHLNETGVSE